MFFNVVKSFIVHRYKVTVLAKEYASPVSSGKRITSEIAGALWEWPPAVCGRHTNEKSLERAKVWCMDGYAKFMELAMNSKETGAFLRQSIFYFKDKVTPHLPHILIRRIVLLLFLLLDSENLNSSLDLTLSLSFFR